MGIRFLYYPGGRIKALTMSYDDGQVHDRRLVELFNRYGIRGTFHLNSGFFGREYIVEESEIASLFAGHEVSAHGLTHPFLTRVPAGMVAHEIIEDRRKLEALVRYPVRGMSYPFGDYDEALARALPALGIEYSRTTRSHGGFSIPTDFLAWHPTCHHNQCREALARFKHTNAWEQLPLLYVWGHSFEFDRNGDWDVIEGFCQAAAFDDDVWYATNIEVKDYLTALRGLKCSADMSMAQNLSAIPVWVDVDGQAVEVEPGKLISI